MLTENLWAYLRQYGAKHQAQGNGFGFGLVGPEDVPGLARAIESLMVADVDSGVRTRLALRTQAEFGIDAGLRRWDGVLSVAVAMRWDAV